MTTRRDFIKQSSLLSAAFLVNSNDFFKTQKRIGVQLYTLRNDLSKNPRAVLEQVAALGYLDVETFGYNKGKWFGMTATEFAAELKKNGLKSPSGHTFPGGMFLKAGWEEDWKKAVDDSKTLGQEYIVIPWLEEPHRKSIDNYKKIAEGLNKAAGMAKEVGLKFAYHNHDFEFANIDGQTGFDILMNGTDPKLVGMELDIYWAVRAGKDPVELFKANPGRFPLWHIKDMDKTEKKFFTEVGNGVIDFKTIFASAKKAGMKHFYVEQDQCPGAPIDSIKKSIEYMKANLVK